jgi:FAD/FMN-containing dehydrogenase
VTFAPITDPEVLEGYLTDASNVRGHAEALVRPRSTEEVAKLVRHCQAEGIPLTVTAGRTSTTAAPVPFGGWLLSTERLGRILTVEHDTATAEGGVFLGAFQEEIEAKGRFFPPDPTSRRECTLGAAIACNASGARSFRYGPTRPWVQGLEVVTGTGQVLVVERGDPVPADWPIPEWEEPRVKTAAGYAPRGDAVDVFIGQEGTLGIITRATVRLTDLPAAVIGLLAWFPGRDSALDFAERAREHVRTDPAGALSPRCLEYLDLPCLEIARDQVPDIPSAVGAALFCEQEVEPAHGEDGHLAAWWEALEGSGALAEHTLVTTDPAGQQKLHALRHAIPAGINEQVVRNGMPKVGTDLAVPDEALRSMMDHYEAAPVPHVVFGHLGDNHLHLNMLPQTAAELEQARAYYRRLSRIAVDLGGTVSAEHGIGKLKKEHLAEMVSPTVLDQFRCLKTFFDPGWILGRGTLFDR